jgi:hypothetical protein
MHLVELQEIWRIVLADEFGENLIDNLKLKIDIYLKTWSIFYPDVKLIPKQHFLTHYPTSTIKFRPPKAYWVMRLESKHSYFKSVNKAVHNNINKTKQLANRHQYLQAYHLLMPNYFNEIELGCIKNLDLTYTSLFELLLNKTNIDYYNWIIKRGIKYCINDFIVDFYI